MALIVSDITQVRRQLASLANAATWLSLTTAGITASANALTTQANEPVFTSTAVDAGKQIVIRGAGTGGADLYTKIATVVTAISATTVDNAVTTVANALAAFGGDVDDDRHTIQEMDEAMFESDQDFVAAIIETLGHWARADYLAISGSIASGAQLPSHIGSIAEILIQNSSLAAYLPGTIADLKAIQRWNANTGTAPNNVYGSTAPTAAGSPLAGYYNVDPDNYLWYTGSDAKARLYQYTRSLIALLSPIQYQGGVVNRSMMKLTLKDGDDPVAASAWAKFAQDDMALVRMGAQQAA